MEYAVKLKSVPSDIQFPDNLQRKIRFDARNEKLIYRGFMCKSDYDQLLRLHEDVSYQNAVTQLFQKSTFSAALPMRNLGRVLATLTVGCLVLAAFVWWFLINSLPT